MGLLTRVASVVLLLNIFRRDPVHQDSYLAWDGILGVQSAEDGELRILGAWPMKRGLISACSWAALFY